MSSDVSLKILSKSVGSTVLVRLRNGKVLRGLLKGYDQHMNIVLEDTDELIDENTQNKLGTIVVRGDSIVMISPP
ncbi:small nuclear ribonucleoprotein [Candidatus Caldarchaeum subterraneum]|uniref:Putative snRNP Sm-like protein n=1 Tax=Caldiarchaeum subterraneum TaxID=311458 RepID=E6N419_CALS0|nr:small nuclear ribonucleoprotein [Candidatus Caldarchaeum subterraneum]BAJ48182.1 small nuclear ribonucleoprotein [Candidatus Caldarchaeum subterraneum]BAJ48238.1 small nuclear ribonucleoprotein [Candidatus Caldarchaeum subterraneum]BAJ50956.1 small nuclear ribonucleoprotein [Candidatus Caldarchaeum subterraneum]